MYEIMCRTIDSVLTFPVALFHALLLPTYKGKKADELPA